MNLRDLGAFSVKFQDTTKAVLQNMRARLSRRANSRRRLPTAAAAAAVAVGRISSETLPWNEEEERSSCTLERDCPCAPIHLSFTGHLQWHPQE